jgi:hypothetical protein
MIVITSVRRKTFILLNYLLLLPLVTYEGCVQKSGDIRGTCTYNLASRPL